MSVDVAQKYIKRVAGNVYCTREYDSLKISNGKWYWWSRGIGGYSALDYLMKMRELGFVEAVQTLTGDMGDWKPPPPAVKKDEPKVLLLPEKNPNCDKVTEYLFGRGIVISSYRTASQRALFSRADSTITPSLWARTKAESQGCRQSAKGD